MLGQLCVFFSRMSLYPSLEDLKVDKVIRVSSVLLSINMLNDLFICTFFISIKCFLKYFYFFISVLVLFFS